MSFPFSILSNKLLSHLNSKFLSLANRVLHALALGCSLCSSLTTHQVILSTLTTLTFHFLNTPRGFAFSLSLSATWLASSLKKQNTVYRKAFIHLISNHASIMLSTYFASFLFDLEGFKSGCVNFHLLTLQGSSWKGLLMKLPNKYLTTISETRQKENLNSICWFHDF